MLMMNNNDVVPVASSPHYCHISPSSQSQDTSLLPRAGRKGLRQGNRKDPGGQRCCRQAAFGPVLWRGRWRPLWPKLATFPTGSQEAGQGVGLCRVASLQEWDCVQGTSLGSSEPDGPGRVLEAHCPDKNTEARGHTVWVAGSQEESSLDSADPPPMYSPSHQEQGGHRAGAGGQAGTGTCPTSLCQQHLSHEFTATGEYLFRLPP